MRLQQRLERRADELRTWLKEHGQDCWNQQKHLSDGSAEQIYWHYGYLAALRDVLKQLDDRPN